MSLIGTRFKESNTHTFILDDTTSALYSYSGWAPRADATALADKAARTAAEFWYVERTPKVGPFITESAGVMYDRKWDTVIADGLADDQWV